MAVYECEIGEYEIIEGVGGMWSQDEDGNETLTFKANGAFSKFIGIEVDGVEVGPENYTADPGSTIIKLKPEYLKTLSGGWHTLTVLYQGGGSCSTKFEIKKAPGTQVNQPGGQAAATPQTGDNNNLSLWLVLLAISCVGATGTIIIVYNRKKKNSEK